jgi:hypothetical protein
MDWQLDLPAGRLEPSIFTKISPLLRDQDSNLEPIISKVSGVF